MVESTATRTRIVVRGVVQGVGFRPFVYRLAHDYHLNGWVLNSTEGVVIEVEGENTDGFVRDLTLQPPPLARIERVEVSPLPPIGYSSFSIHRSEDAEGGVALVSPDTCVCDDCLRELFTEGDRRYRYPFINCTNCGPRFTITRDIPYDRPKTTMEPFVMCPDCQQEYDDPENRRFHAQPNACPECGPVVSLVVGDEPRVHGDKAVEEARHLLRIGRIVAVKGLGGFHLACSATDEEAVAELRQRKRRVEKPFALMAIDAAAAERFCELDDDERRLLQSPQRPIVLLRKREPSQIAASVAPGNANLGVMLPYTPLHYLLLEGDMPQALVMTSGNLSEEPIAVGNDEALDRLAGLADAFLLHNRDIHVRCDDSVTRVHEGKETVLRRSRGYAPFPVKLREPVRHTLACGGELKNTFAVARDDHAFLSQHIGDLENVETLRSFEDGIEHFERLFHVTPEVVAHDLHPDYLSTQYALGLGRQGLPLVGVQHHHAHVVSCMTENGLGGPTIGVAFDGTGYGLDGAVWGGEILVADEADFERVGHLAYVPLPGGSAAIKRPFRTALSLVHAAFGEFEPALAIWRRLRLSGGEAPAGNLGSNELAVLERQVRGQFNSPLTSSMGRLFDAVSALVGLRQVVNYEAQAAIELEMAADEGETAAYGFPVRQEGTSFLLDPAPLIREVVRDVAAGAPVAKVSAKFHNAVAEATVEACRLVRARRGLRRVVLSGGVFQNMLLLRRTLSGLRREDFEVYVHHQLPCNDGGISLGQVVIANARAKG
ncbi:MAG: carbamoyltransferase HypF [Chloroflexota bacterium]